MKVVLKGGSVEGNDKIEKFFMKEIFPILGFGIAIEPSDSIITVYEKGEGGVIKKYVDSTAEVIVELSEEVISLIKGGKVSNDELKQKSGNFFDEARAIKKVEELRPPFSIEYYSCRYSPPPSETQEVECNVHGSIKHMQSATGECPGCGET